MNSVHSSLERPSQPLSKADDDSYLPEYFRALQQGHIFTKQEAKAMEPHTRLNVYLDALRAYREVSRPEHIAEGWDRSYWDAFQYAIDVPQQGLASITQFRSDLVDREHNQVGPIEMGLALGSITPLGAETLAQLCAARALSAPTTLKCLDYISQNQAALIEAYRLPEEA